MRTFFKKIKSKGINILILAGILFLFLALKLPQAQAATLSLSPSGGIFTVGSTFDVSVFLNTEGQSDNVVIASISFPPEKLQLISPTTGKSVIEVWTAPPVFNNETGLISLEGGMPGGINVSQALITRLTFRVKGVGSAMVKFTDQSRVLLNDGKGTDALDNTSNGIYNLILPPPAGPVVASETHLDQSVWYANANAVLQWQALPGVTGYSYILSDNPVDTPPDIVNSTETGVVYKNLPDGTHYFHIKALRNGAWGGITHFALNVDTSPPAEFPIEITPDSRTTRRQPAIEFLTTDNISGIDHYELKIIPLTPSLNYSTSSNLQLFIEAQSPYITPELDFGDYDVIVRAYNKAGNYREETQRLQIVNTVFSFISDKGLGVRSSFVIPWIVVWLVSFAILVILLLLAVRIWKWHNQIHRQLLTKEMPNYVRERLSELQQYRKRYGKLMLLLLALGLTLFFSVNQVRAQNMELAPPFVSIVSRNISNEEIFYIGGRTDAPNVQVVIYLQNLQTGETLSENTLSDEKGEWFYRHPTFLTSGSYLLWTQSRIGEQLSPPSPQIQMLVSPTAIQFGASRLSYETLYLIIAVMLAVIILALALFIAVNLRRGRKKKNQFLKEVREAEASVSRGFAVLRRDIESELAIIKKVKLNKQLSAEEKSKESQLLNDLDSIQKYITKEVWDVEHLES